MGENSIRWEVTEGVATITIDRPQRRNALDGAARDALVDCLLRARSDPAVRAVLLTGTGDAFCTGADLAAGSAGQASPAAGDGSRGIDPRGAAEALRFGAQRLVRTLYELDKPTVAAVAGPAAGMGAHLALACDLVVMAEGARLIEVFARRGLVVDALGAWLLVRLVGLARAKRLALLAEDLSAAEALSWGVAYSVVPRESLQQEATRLARRLAVGPTRALGLSKQLLNRAFEVSLDVFQDAEAQAVGINTQYADMKEGLVAFLERRTPEFSGR